MSAASTAHVAVYQIFHPIKTWSKDDTAYPQQQDPSEYVTDIFFGKFRHLSPDFEKGSGHDNLSPIAGSRQIGSQIVLVADR